MSFVNLILLAIVPTVISNITLVLAVHNIGGTLTAVLGAVEPITAVCVGILVFSEPFTPNLAVGIPAYHHCCNDDYPVQIDPGHITEIIQESGPFSGFEISPYNRHLTFIVLRACD